MIFMNRHMAEESILFFSVIKWVAMATLVGALTGAAVAVFVGILNASIQATSTYPYYFLLLPVAMIICVFLGKIAPQTVGHGTEKVIEAIHGQAGRMPFLVAPVKLVATTLTAAFGGSVGKEGPSAQIGAAIASTYAGLMGFGDTDRRKLAICGISAGFAAVFGTPIAGAIFGVEVLVVGGMFYDVLLPSFVAGVVGYHIAASMGVHALQAAPITAIPVFDASFFGIVIAAGVFFGLCAFAFIEIIHYLGELSRHIPGPAWARPLAGGLAVIALALLFNLQFMGLGNSHIEAVLAGQPASLSEPPLKALATGLTLEFGGSGGLVLPIFYIGTTAGSLFGQLLGQSLPLFAALGLVALLAGATNAPIAASILAIELFGPAIGPYAAVCCVVSFLMTGHRSVYPAQMLGMRKSDSLDVEIGGRIEHARAKPKPRDENMKGLFESADKAYAAAHHQWNEIWGHTKK